VNELKVETKTIHVVEGDALEAYVEQVFTREWWLIDPDARFSIDETVHVTGELSDYEARDMESWADYAGPPPSARAVMNALAARGLIAIGEYLVKGTK
jgi:hypothetical protein